MKAEVAETEMHGNWCWLPSSRDLYTASQKEEEEEEDVDAWVTVKTIWGYSKSFGKSGCWCIAEKRAEACCISYSQMFFSLFSSGHRESNQGHLPPRIYHCWQFLYSPPWCCGGRTRLTHRRLKVVKMSWTMIYGQQTIFISLNSLHFQYLRNDKTHLGLFFMLTDILVSEISPWF